MMLLTFWAPVPLFPVKIRLMSCSLRTSMLWRRRLHTRCSVTRMPTWAFNSRPVSQNWQPIAMNALRPTHLQEKDQQQRQLTGFPARQGASAQPLTLLAQALALLAQALAPLTRLATSQEPRLQLRVAIGVVSTRTAAAIGVQQ
jgi:hypothetical protein